MRIRMVSILLALALVLSLTGAAVAESFAVVNNPDPSDRLNLRTEPNADAATLGKYYSGVYVQVLDGVKDGWAKVRIGNQQGYMLAKYLAFDQAAGAVTPAIPVVTINNKNGTGLNLREGRSSSTPSQGLYKNGSKVMVYGVGVSWCHVYTEDGKTGFMLRNSLSPVLPFDKGAGSGTGAGAVKLARVHNPDPEDRLNLRTKPDTKAGSMGKYYNGVNVELLEARKSGWVKVRIGSLVGYMQTKFLEPDSKKTVQPAMPLCTVNAPGGIGLDLYDSPSKQAKSLGQYQNGTQGWVYGLSSDWCHIQMSDGKIGFMPREKLFPVLVFDKSGK